MSEPPIKEQDAEIERLKDQINLLQGVVGFGKIVHENDCKLITELADALDVHASYFAKQHNLKDLLQRARETHK